MADISAELQAIMDAVYGEEVRGSIHDAIEKINTINDTGVAEINEVAAEALSALSQARSAVNGWPRIAYVSVDATEAFEKNIPFTMDQGQAVVSLMKVCTDDVVVYGDSDIVFNQYKVAEAGDTLVHIPLRTFVTLSMPGSSETYPAFNYSMRYANRTEWRPKNTTTNLSDALYWTVENVGFSYPLNTITEHNDVRLNAEIHRKNVSEAINQGYLDIAWRELLIAIPQNIIDTNDTIRDFVERIGAVKIKAGVGEKAILENDIENNTAGGDYAHAEGGLTIASGDYAHAEGTGYDQDNQENNQANVASGYASHAEGYKTKASKIATHAEGSETTASGNYAHAEGSETTASGLNSHAEGYQTTASGLFTHAEGRLSTASGRHSHAEGYDTTSSGELTHAEGFETRATAYDAHVEGYRTIASGRYSHVSGKYNIEDTEDKYAEIVGNGSGNGITEERSNARTLDWEGTGWFAKSLELGPHHDELTPERVRMIDNVVETLKAVSDTRIVSGPTAEFSDAQAGMPITHLEGEIIFDTEQDGSFTGKTSITLTEQHNEDTPVTYTVTFPEDDSPVFGGYFDFPTGKLYITMISSSMEWGDMQFSIDPDNYLGKRIPLPNCVCGFSGEDKTFCNVTDNYIYDQSASTHFYVYRDDETTGYAVVVLPDTTPDDTVIQVVGTLAEPIVIDLDTYLLVASAGDNSFSVDTGDILKCEYIHDVASQEYDELDAKIDAIRQLPAYPTTDGTYLLKLTVADGEPTLQWESE